MSLSRKLALVAAVASGALLSAAPLSFCSTELSWAALGSDYHAAIHTLGDGRCSLADVALSVVDGVLPDGLMIQGNTIAGTPKQMGLFRFRLHAANNCAAVEHDFELRVTGKPVLRVSPEELTFEYQAGDPAPKPRNMLVSSTWPELPYSVTVAADWVRVRLREGVTPVPGAAFSSDSATVEVIPQDLKPGVYQTTLVFLARQGATPPAVPVRLKVTAAPVAAAQTAK